MLFDGDIEISTENYIILSAFVILLLSSLRQNLQFRVIQNELVFFSKLLLKSKLDRNLYFWETAFVETAGLILFYLLVDFKINIKLISKQFLKKCFYEYMLLMIVFQLQQKFSTDYMTALIVKGIERAKQEITQQMH